MRAYHAELQSESLLCFFETLSPGLLHPERVTVPMLVLGAAQDRLFLPSEIRATARAYRTEEKTFSGLAHDLMLGGGSERVFHRIRDWLKEHPG